MSRPDTPDRCPGTLGERPDWMSPDQFDPCPCTLPARHQGEHRCEHGTEPQTAWNSSTPAEPAGSVDGQAVETRAQQLTRMVADVIAANPCNRERDVDGHAATECPTAKAVIGSLSRTSALRTLVELAPDHPRKPVLPESLSVVPPSARVDGETGKCGHNCAACWCERHAGHDVGWRHEDGALYSATCHDCGERYLGRSS